ncbi:hypothetical protein Btru_009492 [Bulinus truncatus]|nr:hypothetical protein Btru_009492 [Bulinus truncatus]
MRVSEVLRDRLTGFRGGRARNHRCQTCDKSYIGQAGLNRHYRLNPDHCNNPSENGSISSVHNGSLDCEDSKDASLLQDGNSSHMSDTTAEVSKAAMEGVDNFSEDSNTQDSLNSIGATSPVVKRGRGRGGYRGRWAHWKQNAQLRRKSKLKELMKQCTDEELMEVVLPRLVSSVSVWEFLMMKSEKGGSRPQVDVIFREFESLKQNVQKACTDYLQALSPAELEDDNLQCKMIKVSDENLAACLGLDTLTYRVREMPPGDSNSFSSLHNKLSAAAITVVSSAKHVSTLEFDDTKRLASHVPLDHAENQAKKPKMSTPISWGKSTQPVSSSTCVITSQQQPSPAEDKTVASRPGSALSSMSSLSSSSVTSPQSQPAHFSLLPTAITSSTPSVSSSSLTLTSTVSKPLATSSSTVRSPYVHIACPTTKSQSVSYVLSESKGHNLLASNKASRTLSVPITPHLSAGQVLPALAGLPQKLIVAAPQNQLGTHSAGVLTSTTSAGQQPGTTTLLLANTAPSPGHRVVVRQPPQHQTKVIVPVQSTLGKPQGHSTISLLSSAACPTSITNSLSLLKPAEVKVSRQLFHDTTSATVSTSTPLSNGRSSCKTASILQTDLHTVFQQQETARDQNLPVITSIVSNGITYVNKSKFAQPRTLVTPPSGQQFIASPNKATGGQVGVSETEMDDIEVLNSLEFPDDLGTLTTSADSFNGTIPITSHLGGQVVNDLASVSDTESFIHSHSVDSGCKYISSVDAAVTSSPSFGMIQNGGIGSLDGMTYINGSSGDFTTNSSAAVNIKDSGVNGNNGEPFTGVTSPTSADFITISKPSVGFNNPALLSSSYTNGIHQDLKSNSVNSSSLILGDMSGLQYGEHGDATVHLNGNSLLQSVEAAEDSMSILSDQLTVPEPQDVDSQFMDTRDGVMPDVEADNQIYLSEGSNIYQTEDGTLIIQSANGNMYQLHGGQGMSLEAVQALLSGHLDQLTGETGSEGVQL